MSQQRSKRHATTKRTAPPPARDERPSTAEVDALLVQSTVRWALVLAAGIAAYSVGVFAGYPYPGAIDGTRTLFYVVTGLLLIVATGFITFLAYRMVTMRVVRRGRTLYLLFLPTVMLLSAVVAILLINVPA